MEKNTKSFGRKNSSDDKKTSYGNKKSYNKAGSQYKSGEKSAKGGKSYRGDKKTFANSEKSYRADKKTFANSDKPYRTDKKTDSSTSKTYRAAKNPASGKNKYTAEKRDFNKKSKFTPGERIIKHDKKTAVEKESNILDNRIEIALQALIDVEKNGKYINLAFKHNDKLDKLEKKDRAYVMRILYGVTEKSYTIDWLLQKVLKEKRIKPWLKAILKIGVYQIYYMRIEDKDAIIQARELCKKYVSDEVCGFVEAVLNKLSESKDEYSPELYRFKNTSERLAVVYSYPQWLIDMWTADYGAETVSALVENEYPRAINLRVSSGTSRSDITAQLDAAKIKCSDGILYNTISVSDTVNIESLDCYRNGHVTAQGIGSMLTVDILDVKRNSSVLDACAAPGGKTFYIAEKTTANVESCDIHEHRVELIKKGIERLSLENVNAVCRDMCVPVPEYDKAFDRVLIDAPCSGLGMINSKPDIKNNTAPEELQALSEIQSKLLETCSSYVKPGGLLVYSTCTVSKQENESNIKRFICEHNEFELIDIDSKIPDSLNYIIDDKTITILPSKYNPDAFFISAMRRIQ